MISFAHTNTVCVDLFMGQVLKAVLVKAISWSLGAETLLHSFGTTALRKSSYETIVRFHVLHMMQVQFEVNLR